MKITDHYPETLREIYDHIQDVIEEAGASASSADMALQVTEWIRLNWSKRWLIPSWWKPMDVRQEEGGAESLPGVIVQVDPVKTLRGRELRAVAFGVLITHPGTGRPCDLASAIAERVEEQWSRKPVYIPKASSVDRAIRDYQIWKDFGGFSTLDKVLATHNLSQSSIYEVFRRVQKEKRLREEPLLPGF